MFEGSVPHRMITLVRARSLPIALSAFFLGTHTVCAAAYNIPNEKPNDFDAIKTVIEQEIPEDLKKAQCGGWDFEDSVNGKFANVSGVPGRTGNPLGNPRSGMAARAEGSGSLLSTKDISSVCGFRSSCRPGEPSFYKYFPCQRPLGNIATPQCDDDPPNNPQPPGRGEIEFSCGGGQMPENGSVCGSLDTTGGLCGYLNTHWIYGYYEKSEALNGGCSDALGVWHSASCTVTRYHDGECKTCQDEIEPTYGEYTLADTRECCTHQSMDGTIYGPETGRYDTSGDTVMLLKNCEPCNGSNCEEQEKPRKQFYPPWNKEVKACKAACVAAGCSPGCISVSKGPSKRGQAYRSFYRHYTASYTRDKVKSKYVSNDDADKTNIPVSCYSLFDTDYTDFLATKAANFSKNCVIAAYYPGDRNFWKMDKTQKGKGEYGSAHSDGPATHRTASDPDNLWSTGMSNAFSLTNGEVMKEKYNDDLTLALYQPSDPVELLSLPQIDLEHMFSTGALLRAFDDTVSTPRGTKRTITEWWQEQETQMHVLLTPPSVRILLPPAWSVGLDILDPFFTPHRVSPSTTDPRLDSIEVQLEARPDLLDEVKLFLRYSLLPTIEQEPLPVVVPMGSATEFRAYAEGWREWIKMQQKLGSEEDIATAQKLVNRLEEYALAITETRKLRAELAQMLGQLFEHEKKITSQISEWLSDKVLSDFERFQTELTTIATIRKNWEKIQARYRQIHDEQCMPWCHSERFTVPIYSLLDPWLPNRPGLDAADLPKLSVPRLPDASFDFTMLRLHTGSLKLPVLKPIQLKLKTETLLPPFPYAKYVSVPVLPPLPETPSIVDDRESFFPTIETGTPPPSITFNTISSSELSEIQATIAKIKTLLTNMGKEYNLFWESMTLGDPEDGEPFKARTEQDCYKRHDEICVHTEFDLRERIARFGSRPAILLKEDLASLGKFRLNPGRLDATGKVVGFGADSCPGKDWACQILNGTDTFPRSGWSVSWSGIVIPPDPDFCSDPASDDPIEQARVCLLRSTACKKGSSSSAFPYEQGCNDIIPSFAVPPPSPLIPVPTDGSSSSSSGT